MEVNVPSTDNPIAAPTPVNTTGLPGGGTLEQAVSDTEQVVAPAEPQSAPIPEHLRELTGDLNSVEDLANAYKELRTKMSQGGEPQLAPQTPAETAEQTVQGLPPDLVQKAQSELLMNRAIGEDTRRSLIEHGVPEDVISYQEQSMAAIGELYTKQIVAEVGSVEDYARMQLWAQNNLDEADLAKYTEAVNSGQIQQALPYVRGLAARYREAISDPRQVEGHAAASTGVEPFRSRAEMLAAMEDPRYGLGNPVEADPDYKREVLARVAASGGAVRG